MSTERLEQEPSPAPFSHEHSDLRGHLEHVERLVARLATTPPDRRPRTMARIVGFFDGEILPHAAWEERVLYPLIDRRFGADDPVVTASLRYEHGLVRRWTAELAAEARRRKPDPAVFVAKAHRLLGLLAAHCEVEENVLLPILDSVATPDDVLRAETEDRQSPGMPE